MVCVSFTLKLSCHTWTGRFALSAICAIFIILTYDIAASQSKAQITNWLQQPDLMLDMSVWLTIDVAFQIFFCILAAKAMTENLGRKEKIMIKICLWTPGILIFPVLFAILTELIFTMTGIDFDNIARLMAAVVLVLFPLMAFLMKWLIPESDIRLETLFMVNLIIVALGIVATVNGRTAAVGTNEVKWESLIGFMVIMATGAVSGFFINKYITQKKITK